MSDMFTMINFFNTDLILEDKEDIETSCLCGIQMTEDGKPGGKERSRGKEGVTVWWTWRCAALGPFMGRHIASAVGSFRLASTIESKLICFSGCVGPNCD
jgi:hypothetical protein